MNHKYLSFENNADNTKSPLIQEINDAIDICRQKLSTEESLKNFNDVVVALQRTLNNSKSSQKEVRLLKEKINQLTNITDPEKRDQNNLFRIISNKLTEAQPTLDYYKTFDPFDNFYYSLSKDDKNLAEIIDFVKLADKIKYSLLDDEAQLQKKRLIRLGLIARIGVALPRIKAEFKNKSNDSDNQNITFISPNLFIEQEKKLYAINAGFPFSRTYQRVINQLNQINQTETSEANEELLKNLEYLFYRTDLNEIQKLQIMRTTFLTSLKTLDKSLIPSLLQILDPFYVAYSETPEQFKKLSEVQYLLQIANNTSYTKIKNTESINKIIERNTGLVVRLRHIIVQQIYQIPYQDGITNKWDEFHHRKGLVANIDAEISELKLSIRRDFPFSFFYQHLRFELNEAINEFPNKSIPQLFIALDKIHSTDKNEHQKLQEFEQAVIDFYYHEIRAKESICDSKPGDILLDFLISPNKLNLEEKYDIKIPKDHDPKTKLRRLNSIMKKLSE